MIRKQGSMNWYNAHSICQQSFRPNYCTSVGCTQFRGRLAQPRTKKVIDQMVSGGGWIALKGTEANWNTGTWSWYPSLGSAGVSADGFPFSTIVDDSSPGRCGHWHDDAGAVRAYSCGSPASAWCQVLVA